MAPSHPNFHTEVLKSEVFEGAQTKPVYLTRVEVNGGDNFTKEFFGKLLTPLVEQSDYTLAQLLDKTEQSYTNLQRTQVFKTIAPSLHVDYLNVVPDKQSYNREKPIITKVIFDLEPAEISDGQAALGFNSEDNLVVDLGYLNNNFNHNAEGVNIGVNYRPYKPSEHLDASVRVVSCLRNPAFQFVLNLYNSHDNNQVWQQNSSKATGGVIGVAYTNAQKTLSLFQGLALTKRTVYDIEDGAHDSLKVFGGDFLKSSVVSKLAYTNVAYLDAARVFAVSGLDSTLSGELSSDQEQAGPLNVFVKVAGAFNAYRSVWNNAVTAHVFLQGGVVYGDASRVHLADRFYLGGFGSFRGFARNAVNPDGGVQFCNAGVTLYLKAPVGLGKSETSPLRLYATAAVGSVGNRVGDNGVASAGVGLRFFNRWVHMDAGYVVAQRLGGGAFGVRDGFQLEVSLGGSTMR